MAARTYIADLPGGTATTTIQITGKQTLKRLILSITNAAAGKVDVSTISASQIGTAQPTQDVIARFNVSGTAGPSQNVEMDISLPVNPFQSVYVHQTGTGNLGTITLS